VAQEPQPNVQGARLAAVLAQVRRAACHIVHDVGIGMAGYIVEARPHSHAIAAHGKLALKEQIQLEKRIETAAVNRRLQKDKAELAELQAQRELKYREDMQIAKRLLQYAKAQGIAYDPKPYFQTYPRNSESVFSKAAVEHEINRDQLEHDIRGAKFPVWPDKKPKAA
jgi:hypothetical protein